jgi:two-component system KDP operon response regulator KdpE
VSAPVDTVLVVEDDAQARGYLNASLASSGFRVIEAETMTEGARRASESVPALVLLDLGLPDGDGVELVRTLRAWSAMPIIVLTARDREGDKIAALDAGADDYVTKPFAVGELLARIRVALRHARAMAAGDPDPVLVVDAIRVDLAAHEVTVDGEPVRLTPIEFRLLALLACNAGKVLTHKHILHEVWGPNATQHTEYLRVHMASLRRKIEKDPARPRWLTTEPGVGYRLRGRP